MDNSDPLVPFGIAIILVVGGFIIVPFLRGKTDFLNGWNTLLLGLICFAGLGSIEVKYVNSFPWEQLNWFQPTVKEVQWYMWATTAFIAALLAAYYFNKPAMRFAQRRLQKWPEVSAPLTLFVLGCCLSIVIISFFVGRVTFIGPTFFRLAHKAAVFACVFSFMPWYRNRLNVSWLLVFLGTLLIAALYAMLVSSGRRLLLSIFLGPILCVYWVHVRHWKPTKIIVVMALVGFAMLSVSTMYARFRWYNLAGGEQRTVSGLVAQLNDLRTKGGFFTSLVKNRLTYFGQQNGHFALLTERYVAQGALAPVPLNTLRFLATYPIPRNVWSAKPQVVGVTIVNDAARMRGTNWGVGIAGHGAYEGGIPALILYAVLLAFLVRIIDEPLRLQPTNPFLIAIHAAALPQVLAIPRGDIGVLIIEIAECILFAVLLGIACRAIFGTQRLRIPTAATRSQWQNSSAPAYRLTRFPQAD